MTTAEIGRLSLDEMQYQAEIARERKAFREIFEMQINRLDPSKIPKYSRYLTENYEQLRDMPPERYTEDELSVVMKRAQEKLEKRRGQENPATD